jgi:putative restriction endonuclease
MRAFVAVTDRDWFDFLSRQYEIDEVNFWQPQGGNTEFRALARGQPLLFKLKAPVNAIAGVGFFEYFAQLPLGLAWDAFGIKNGAASLEAVREKIARLRRSHNDPHENFTVGCLVLVEPVFWPQDLWIPQPEDFHPQVVRGKSYDLSTGTGAKLWAAVAERFRLSEGQVSGPGPFGGFSDPSLVRRRIGQGTFRVAVTQAYERQCAVTRERALPALEAAHIRPFAETAVHYVREGLLLRSDVHRLFDRGYITVTPSHHVEASMRMKDDFNDGDTYIQLHGKPIWVPDRHAYRPDPEALRWHNENVYRG